MPQQVDQEVEVLDIVLAFVEEALHIGVDAVVDLVVVILLHFVKSTS